MDDYEQIAIDILNYKDLINNQYEYYAKRHSELEKFLTIDAYHIFGLDNLDAISIMSVGSIFNKAAKERMEVKKHAMCIGRIEKVFNKYKSFFKELEKELKNIKNEKNGLDNAKYSPRSKLGQYVVDEFSKSDKLDKSLKEDKLKELKNVIEMKNCI